MTSKVGAVEVSTVILDGILAVVGVVEISIVVCGSRWTTVGSRWTGFSVGAISNCCITIPNI